MRPLELSLRNFRSYAGEHVFDFRGRKLVGIVGPIGSGKSSLLDAVAFALYGRTPRIGSATRTLINQRAADSAVMLRFVVEGEVWEATRSIRVKGQSKHALYRYEEDLPDGEPVEKLLMENEVNERVVELLGLDFSAFERSVLLAQGRFAEFLQARPADRDKVLKGVFGHDRVDRMKQLAKARRDDASHGLDKLVIRLERFDEIKARLAAGQTELEEARHRHKDLEEAVPLVSELDDVIKLATEEAAAAATKLADLEEHAGRLPDSATTARALDEAAAAAKRRSELATTLDEAEQQGAKAEKALVAATDSGEPELIQRATKLLAAAEPQLRSVVDADRRIAAAEERLAAATPAVKAVRTSLAQAEAARDKSLGRAAEAAKILEEAEAALEEGRHADMATTLRQSLLEGEQCPVCEQPVHELPDSAGTTHVIELEEVMAAARLTKSDVDAAHVAALGSLERAKEQLQSALDKREAAEAQLAAAREEAVRVRGDLEETTMQLEKILGPGDPQSHLEKRRTAFEALVAERDDAQRRSEQARGAHDQAIRDEQEAGKAMQDLGIRLAELAARLGTKVPVGDDAESLRSGLEQIRKLWTESTDGLREAKSAAESRAGDKRGERLDLLKKLGVDGDLPSALAVLADRIGRLDAAVTRDGEEVAQADALYDQKEKLADQVELFGRINQDLTDSRFVRFLLDEERARLAELGSEHFQQLSAGRYRFADERFAIMDLTAADVTRKPDSLSGGETFLASLGLALALAEMVAGSGGRLDAFFLDEGFGTLDPEHLDLAMQGIERLVADDSERLVVIVSHVPELRMRLEDLIELDRNAVTGDTRVLSH